MYDNLHVTFRVGAIELNPGEVVCVSGNCDALGNWNFNGVLPLEAQHDPILGDLWTGRIQCAKRSTLRYRYVVCMILDQPKNRVIVRRWETNLEPRKISNIDDNEDSVASDQFGYIDAMNYDVQGGWMTHETIVQLKLYNMPVQIWKRKYAGKHFRLKMTAIDLRRHDSESAMDEDSTNEVNDTSPTGLTWPITELAVMNDSECEFTLQSQFGRVTKPDESVVFQVQVIEPESIAYLVDFYVEDVHRNEDDPNPPEHAGFCYILPSVFRQTTGVSTIPVTGFKRQPIGQLTVEYLVIRPMRDYECDLSVSYAKHWKRGRKTLDVGHRGAGSSFNKTQHCANIRENTVTSLKHAANHGADFVEFDVQVSKDLVPIIYHDFHVCICTKKKYSGDDSELLEVPVKDLTVLQLQGLKLQHVTERAQLGAAGTNGSSMATSTSPVGITTTATPRLFVHDDHEDSQPFPTFKQVLDAVDLHVGFNVEIKWNLQRKDGSQELHSQMEVNLYLDTILKVLMENAGKRRIVISCFNPDICTMVRLKQNKYPVLFLTQGQSKKFPPYLDPRTASIPMAIYFARSAGILGIDVHTEDLLEDQSAVRQCKDANLIMFSWGEDNNDPRVITFLRNLGLHGVIYDRIDEHKTDKDNVFLMESKSRRALLESAVGTAFCSDTASSTNESILPAGL